jgi:murein tripeptide amidase MpaA
MKEKIPLVSRWEFEQFAARAQAAYRGLTGLGARGDWGAAMSRNGRDRITTFRRASLAILSLTLLVGALIGTGGSAGAGTASARARPKGHLQMYEAVVDSSLVRRVISAGYDLVDFELLADEQARITLVLYPSDVAALQKMGADLEPWRNDDGKTSRQLAKEQSAYGFKVWRSFDEPGFGFRDYMYDLASENTDILELEVVGQSWGTNPDGAPGPSDDTPRQIIALQLTKDADGFAGGRKPAVLYNSLQHAREWIGGEVNRRLLEWFIKQYREGDPEIVDLLTTTELWFILVSNPDGYQYTFTPDNRLWRKNLRDNDGDGKITSNDGVDPNRNFPNHWRWDEEGSSSLYSSETYRGPSAASEPETRAMIRLYNRVDFAFHVNYHSVGQWLLYGLGAIMDTPTADDPLLVALSGTDKRPAIQDFNPGISSAELYVTNGDTNDFAYDRGTLGWVPELSEGPNGDGFIFPDSEGAIEGEFKRNLPFALSVALSARDPDDPISSVGIETEPFYLDVSEIDPQKASNPHSDLTFAHSYGDPQPVQVLAKRDLNDDGATNDPVTLRYSINGGPTRNRPTAEWRGGDRFGGPGDVYYRYMRGRVTGISPGDSVRVWFAGGGHISDSFTFRVIEDNPAQVLVLAAEDYTGATNTPAYPSTDGPFFLSYYTDALTNNGISYDVYDVDARGRVAPSHLGVLGHYDAVIWYTGNDFLTREPDQVPGTGFSTLGFREMLEVRAYLNEGGKLLFTGQQAGVQFAQAFSFNPVSTPPFCDGTVPNSTGVECRIADDDFLQYWLGAYVYEDDAGLASPDNPFDIVGTATPYAGISWAMEGGTSANNQVSAEAFITTSSLLNPATYPQFTSDAPAEWDTGLAGPFDPHTGSYYLYSDQADVSYKRIKRSISVPAGGGTLSFFTSYDTEPAWDFVFVEVNDGGTWSTLPDQNNHTSNDTGDSCPEGWFELHPWLEQYQGADCSGAGWNAASGRSDGWEEWEIDLTPFAGKTIEVYFSYASDWAIQGLGAWFDDVTLSWESGTESFESGTGVWTVPVPTTPPGSAPNPNDWFRSTSVGFDEGAATALYPSDATFRTLYFGFGFEGISTQAKRDEVMCRSMNHLGVTCP